MPINLSTGKIHRVVITCAGNWRGANGLMWKGKLIQIIIPINNLDKIELKEFMPQYFHFNKHHDIEKWVIFFTILSKMAHQYERLLMEGIIPTNDI